MKSLALLRLAAAATWFYQGLYLKLILRDAHHLHLATKLVSPSLLLTLAGVGETLLGLVVLIGLWMRPVAIFQLVLVLAITAFGIHAGWIAHPIASIVGDLPFLACLGFLSIHGAGRWYVG